MSVLAVGGEAFRNWTAGAASIGTAIALIIGGIWAYLRFRHTPESRYKFTLAVVTEWLTLDADPFLRASVSVTNEGGKDGCLLVGLADDNLSRVGLYTLDSRSAVDPGAAGVYVDWLDLPSPDRSAPVLPVNVTLRPSDVWREVVLFKLPKNAVAVLATALIHIQSGAEEAEGAEVRPYRFRVIATTSDPKVGP